MLVHDQLSPFFVSVLTSINLSTHLLIHPSSPPPPERCFYLSPDLLTVHYVYFNFRHISSLFSTILQYCDTLLKLTCAAISHPEFYYSYQYMLHFHSYWHSAGMYLNVWGQSVRQKHVACIDNNNKIVVIDGSTCINFNYMPQMDAFKKIKMWYSK